MMLWMVALVACSEETPPEPQPARVVAPAPAIDARAAKAAAVARAIDGGAAPAEAMKAEGLEPEAFRDLLYEIAADHTLTMQYERARRKGQSAARGRAK